MGEGSKSERGRRRARPSKRARTTKAERVPPGFSDRSLESAIDAAVADPDASTVSLGRRFVARIPAEPQRGGAQGHPATDPRTYSCRLRCWRCMGTTSDGRRCSRHTCKQLPFCWQHLRSNYWLRVGRTQLTDPSGRTLPFDGVYVDRPGAEPGERVFGAGDRVSVYFGERKTRAKLTEEYGFDTTVPYALGIGGDEAMDAACMRSVGALINTYRKSLGGSPQGGGTNCRFVEYQAGGGRKRNRVNIVATRNVYQGQELLIPYGAAYKFDVAHN